MYEREREEEGERMFDILETEKIVILDLETRYMT